MRIPTDSNNVVAVSNNSNGTVPVSQPSTSVSSLSAVPSANVPLPAPNNVPVAVPAAPIVTPPTATPASAVNSTLVTALNNGILLPGPHTHNSHSQPPQRSVPGHSRNSSLDLRVSSNGCAAVASRSTTDIRNMAGRSGVGHSRTASLDLRHTRNSSADLNKLFRNDVGLVFGGHQGKFLGSIIRSFFGMNLRLNFFVCCFILFANQ